MNLIKLSDEMKYLFETALKNNIAPSFLEFIGIQDESATIGVILYHFNVFDPAHPKFESTVVCMHKL